MRVLLTSTLILSVAITSCFQNKTYLTEEEKAWNPYKKGQTLILESSNYERDTISIEALDFGFPDGIGVIDYNESLYVLAEPTGPDLGKYFSSTYGVLTIVAKTDKKPSYVEFGLRAKDAKFIRDQRFSFDYLQALAEIEITVPYGSYDDVITIGSKKDYSNISSAIDIIYWSKSKGYLKFDKYDGTTWELIKIIEP